MPTPSVQEILQTAQDTLDAVAECCGCSTPESWGKYLASLGFCAIYVPGPKRYDGRTVIEPLVPVTIPAAIPAGTDASPSAL